MPVGWVVSRTLGAGLLREMFSTPVILTVTPNAVKRPGDHLAWSTTDLDRINTHLDTQDGR